MGLDCLNFQIVGLALIIVRYQPFHTVWSFSTIQVLIFIRILSYETQSWLRWEGNQPNCWQYLLIVETTLLLLQDVTRDFDCMYTRNAWVLPRRCSVEVCNSQTNADATSQNSYEKNNKGTRKYKTPTPLNLKFLWEKQQRY